MSKDAQRATDLNSSASFQTMPAAMREWILASPNATSDFAEFFAKGGLITPDPEAARPYYSATQPPAIAVEEASWEGMRRLGAPEWGQRAMFAQLMHEVGHDRYNTGNIPFTGKTAEDYVSYRGELEAQAIFNAFPAFKDLEKHPDFIQQFPFNDVGYLSGLELGQIYREWRSGELTDKAAVERIASRVPDAPYTLGGGLQDQDADGRLTHRDLYLRDYSRVVAPESSPQAAQDKNAPLAMSLREGVAGLDARANKGWDDDSERLYASLLVLAKENGFARDDRVQVAFNLQSARYAAGELVHIERIGPNISPDPAAHRASMRTDDALGTPAAENLHKADAIASPEIATTQQPATVNPDDPVRQGPVMRA